MGVGDINLSLFIWTGSLSSSGTTTIFLQGLIPLPGSLSYASLFGDCTFSVIFKGMIVNDGDLLTNELLNILKKGTFISITE